MARFCALLACLLLLSLAAAPASFAGWFPGDPIDGPSPDVVGLGGVDLARDGGGALVYIKRVDGVPHVFLSRLVGGEWRAPERVDGGVPSGATEAVVSIIDEGRTAIAFVSGGHLYGVSTAGGGGDGGPLSGATLLHADPDPALGVRSPHIDMAVNGTAVVTFTAPGAGGSDVRAVRLESAWEPVPVPLDIEPGRAAGEGAGRPRVAVSAEGNSVVTWGEAGAVFARRITELRPSQFPQPVSLPDLGGLAGGAADSPDIDIEDDGSYAWVGWRQDFGGTSRTVARRLVGSQFEAPAALDAGQPSSAPRVAMSGRGTGFAVASGPGVALGSLLERDAFAAASPFGAGGNPVVAASERESAAVAWLADATLRARHKVEKMPFEAEVPVSRPELGAVVAGQYELAGSRIDDFALAMTQGAEGARSITVAHFDRPPGAPYGRTKRRFVGAQPKLEWTAGTDLWGPQTFKVILDGVEVATTTGLSYVPPAPLAPGLHRWHVVSVDRRGQQGVMRRRQSFIVDTQAPAVTLRVSGKRSAGRPLTARVRARDAAGGSGIDRVLISTDGGRRFTRMAEAHTFRYPRAGSYTVVVRVRDKAGNETRKQSRLRIRR